MSRPGCKACEESAPLFDACSFHTVSHIDFDDDESALRKVRLVPVPPDDWEW